MPRIDVTNPFFDILIHTHICIHIEYFLFIVRDGLSIADRISFIEPQKNANIKSMSDGDQKTRQSKRRDGNDVATVAAASNKNDAVMYFSTQRFFRIFVESLLVDTHRG